MKKRYPLLLFSLIGSYYIYKNYFNNNLITNKINIDKKNNKINNDKREEGIKSLTPIKKLARKGGIVETVLNLDIVDEPDLDPGIGLKIETEPEPESCPEPEKKVSFNLELEIDENNYSDEDENLCIL